MKLKNFAWYFKTFYYFLLLLLLVKFSFAQQITSSQENAPTPSPYDFQIEHIPVAVENKSDGLSRSQNKTSECFSLAICPVTTAQYAAFLNAVASKSDPHHLYDEHMNSDQTVACLIRQESDSGYTYLPIAGEEQLPVTYVDLFSAARFCNWLSHGHPFALEEEEVETITETGAYSLESDYSFPEKTSDASWYLPSVQEYDQYKEFTTSILGSSTSWSAPFTRTQNDSIDSYVTEWTTTLSENKTYCLRRDSSNMCHNNDNGMLSSLDDHEQMEPWVRSNQVGFRVAASPSNQEWLLPSLTNLLEISSGTNQDPATFVAQFFSLWSFFTQSALPLCEKIFCQAFVAGSFGSLMVIALATIIVALGLGIPLGVVTGLALAIGAASNTAMDRGISLLKIQKNSWTANILGFTAAITMGLLGSAFLLEFLHITPGVITMEDLIATFATNIEKTAESFLGQTWTQGMADSIERTLTGSTAVNRQDIAEQKNLADAEKKMTAAKQKLPPEDENSIKRFSTTDLTTTESARNTTATPECRLPEDDFGTPNTDRSSDSRLNSPDPFSLEQQSKKPPTQSLQQGYFLKLQKSCTSIRNFDNRVPSLTSDTSSLVKNLSPEAQRLQLEYQTAESHYQLLESQQELKNFDRQTIRNTEYNKALADGASEEKANTLADQAVRRSLRSKYREEKRATFSKNRTRSYQTLTGALLISWLARHEATISADTTFPAAKPVTPTVAITATPAATTSP